jgi:hypothetical protein
MPLTEIREKGRKFQRKIAFRNLREYAAIAVVTVFFGASMWKYPPLMRAGAGLCIAGGLYVGYQLHRRGSSRAMADGLAAASCLDFHRRELERQRNALMGVWSWYLGPLIPGLAVLMAGVGMAVPGHSKMAWTFVSVYSAAVALAFYFVGRLNQRAARRLQRQIDEIDAMRDER